MITITIMATAAAATAVISIAWRLGVGQVSQLTEMFHTAGILTEELFGALTRPVLSAGLA